MIKKYIPNSITLVNLFCGCLAIISMFTNQLGMVPIFIAISLFADYSDGFVARMLKVSSPMGRELDSLADMVSFGVLPGTMLFYMINQSKGIQQINFQDSSTLIGLIGFAVTIFSCVRLAKFNLDTRQTEGFVGLNTPACTIFVLGILLLTIDPQNHYGIQYILTNITFLIITSVLLAYLLIAEIPMFSFKFKSLDTGAQTKREKMSSFISNLRRDKIRLSFLVITLVCLILFKFGAALSIIILNYVLVSVVLWMSGLLKREKRQF